MLHVVTVHWQSDAWIEPQLAYLDRFAPSCTRVWAALNGVSREHFSRFHFASELNGSHADKLNQLAEIASKEAQPADHLLFLDGDAFPVAPLEPLLTDPARLIAVRRDENLGDPQPHPCFCLTTVDFWAQIEGDWFEGYSWTNRLGETVTDVGGNLLGRLRESSVPWLPLLRSNTVNLHPLWFAIYGSPSFGPVVYHHGAGFRRRAARIDRRAWRPATRRSAVARKAAEQFPSLRRIARKSRARRALAKQARWDREPAKLADEVFQAIVAGEDLVARFASSDAPRQQI